MEYAIKKSMASKVVTTKIDDTLQTAYALLKQNRIRHLPVTDDYGDVVGIISHRDFQRAMMRDKYNNPLIPEDFPSDARVGSFMSWPVKTVSPRDSLMEACQKMIDHKISALVIEEKGNMLGIITHEDLLKIFSQMLKEQKLNIFGRIEKWAYNSPIASVVNFLSEVGI